MTGPADDTLRARIERVIDAHRFNKGLGACSCGAEHAGLGRGHRMAEHREHLTDTLLAVLAAPPQREEGTAGLAAWLRDERLTACEHASPLVTDEFCISCSPCLLDRLIAAGWRPPTLTSLRRNNPRRPQ